MKETIFALATAQGRAGVAVIRISGQDAFDVARVLCGSLPDARRAGVRALVADDGDILDEALVICFPGPSSFTGEDVVEFQVHGSVAVIQSVLAYLGKDDRARIAEPGEFTRRALENSRLDLAQVEGLADLIDAETEAQRKLAQRVLSGAIGEKVERWRSDLIRAAALLEATIDFADEDIPVDVSPEVVALLSGVRKDLMSEIDGTFIAERIRTGFEVAIVGPPNSGKSTLLNRLAGRDAAITSDVAGTTRDVIEVRMNLDGLPVTVLDTAGLRDGTDEIEAIGIERALQRARSADLRVILSEQNTDLPITLEPDDIRLTPKVDLLESGLDGISGKTGQGVDDLIKRIKSVFSGRASNVGVTTHERHRIALQRASDGLQSASAIIEQGPDFYDIAAEELRSAIRSLEVLVGRIDVENLLDEIFASFCLGK